VSLPSARGNPTQTKGGADAIVIHECSEKITAAEGRFDDVAEIQAELRHEEEAQGAGSEAYICDSCGLKKILREN
jgi:hypothetical protein